MVLSSCDHVVREVCDRHFSHIRREMMNAMNRPTARAIKKKKRIMRKRKFVDRGSSSREKAEVLRDLEILF